MNDERAYLLEKIKDLQQRIEYLQDCLVRMTDAVFEDQNIIHSLERKNSEMESRMIDLETRLHDKEVISEYWQSRTHQ